MKKFYYLALAAIVSVVMTSCGGTTSTNNEPKFSLGDLQALWFQENDTTDHYVRFTTEKSDESPYLLGREWHEKDPDGAVHEQDILDAREYWGYPCGGWFKYEFKTTGGDLTEIHLMDNGGAELPKVYIVSKLTETTLEYYEKDHSSIKFIYSKVVESK